MLTNSCSNIDDPKVAADEYCKCMSKFERGTNFNWATDLCKVKVSENHPQLRIYYYNSYDSVYLKTVSQENIDYNAKYMIEFNKKINQDCDIKSYFDNLTPAGTRP